MKKRIRTYCFYFLFFFLIGVVYFLGAVAAPWLYHNMRSPVIPYLICMALFFVCLSGPIYNLIRTPGWKGYDYRTGSEQIVMPQGRAQYVLEGLIAAGLITGAALLHVSINAYAELKTAAWKKRLFFYTFVPAYLVVLIVLADIFQRKYQWYPYRIDMPSYLEFLRIE